MGGRHDSNRLWEFDTSKIRQENAWQMTRQMKKRREIRDEVRQGQSEIVCKLCVTHVFTMDDYSTWLDKYARVKFEAKVSPNFVITFDEFDRSITRKRVSANFIYSDHRDWNTLAQQKDQSNKFCLSVNNQWFLFI